LPVVAPAIDRIAGLVCHDREGILYDSSDPAGLAGALERLTDPALRRRIGIAARERAVREYSWSAHCRALDAAIRARRGERTSSNDRPAAVHES
jgi:glycosyltransferase involved in cell wall biosynthesis